MHQKIITLYQHTPLIHFQGDQAGATLRASEVKPRLDKWLRAKHPRGIPKSWLALTDDDKQQSLNYRMKIRPHGPNLLAQKEANQFRGYFADMNSGGVLETKENRLVTLHQTLELTLDCPIPKLAQELTAEKLAPFFYANNFGTRGSKGFGSFSPAVKPSGATFKFYVPFDDFGRLFQNIDFFHRSIRTGLNKFRPPDNPSGGGFNQTFYMKPLIWQYARDMKRVWEKKAYKSAHRQPNRRMGHFHRGKSERDYARAIPRNTTKKDWPLWYEDRQNNPRSELIRDALGLSSVQKWDSSDFKGVSKESTLSKKDPGRIDRAPSPFVFSPVKMSTGFAVYVFAFQPSELYLDHTFEISPKNPDVWDAESLRLQVFPDFKMETLLKKYLDPACLNQLVIAQSGTDKELKEKLGEFYRQAQASLKLENIKPHA